MYLLDTNICIYAIKQHPEHLLERIKTEMLNRLYVSALTIAELEFGVSNSQYPDKNRLALMKFLNVFEIIPFDAEDAISYGKIRSILKKNGQLIGPIDMLLAGQAIAKNLIFVTNNIKEFERVNDLQLQNWIEQ